MSTWNTDSPPDTDRFVWLWTHPDSPLWLVLWDAAEWQFYVCGQINTNPDLPPHMQTRVLRYVIRDRLVWKDGWRWADAEVAPDFVQRRGS